MTHSQSPQLKSAPGPVATPKLKASKSVDLAPEAPKPTASGKEAPKLKSKPKKVKGAFGKEKAKAAPKEKVKLTHNEKMAARRELKKANKLKKIEDFKAAKKIAKKAKRTARRNAEKRKAASRNFTTE